MISRYVSLAIVGVLTLTLGVTFYRVLAPFLLPLFLAAVFALIAHPLYAYFLERTGQRTSLAAGLATGTIVGAFIIPMFVSILLGSIQLFVSAENLLDNDSVQQFLKQLRQGQIYASVIEWGEQFFPILTTEQLQNLSEEEKARIRNEVLENRTENLREGVQGALKSLAVTTLSAGTAHTAVDILAKTGWTLMALITFIIALYYFFSEGPRLLQHVMDLTPVDVNHQKMLFEEFGRSIRAVVSATFLAALAQGLATSMALWFLGFGHFFLYTIVATLAALIPIAGTWLVWIPCAIWLVYQGSWFWAVFLTIYGLAFVGTIDNFIRAYVLHSDAKLHPLLAFVAVLGGLQVMGLWGVFIAPIVASCLYALIRIFNEELVELNRSQKEEPDLILPPTMTKSNQAEEKSTAVDSPGDSLPPQPELK